MWTKMVGKKFDLSRELCFVNLKRKRAQLESNLSGIGLMDTIIERSLLETNSFGYCKRIKAQRLISNGFLVGFKIEDVNNYLLRLIRYSELFYLRKLSYFVCL